MLPPTPKAAMAAAKQTDAAAAKLEARVNEQLRMLDVEQLDDLAEALSEILEMLQVPPLTGGDDPKLGKALLTALKIISDAGVKMAVPDFSRPTSIGALLVAIRDPRVAKLLGQEAAPEDESSGEDGMEDEAEAEAMPAKGKSNMGLFAARVRK